MHLVFLNQYYPPDAAPTGVMLEAVVNELAAQGHEVTVICSDGGYAETTRKTQEGAQAPPNPQSPISNLQSSIIRIPASRFGRGTFAGKLADYLSYYLGTAWRLLWLHPRPRRIIAMTTPPFLSVLARLCSKLRGGDHAHWVMDLYPDVMVAHGMLREGGTAHHLLATLARWGFGGRRCAARLTLGPDMAERIDRLVNPGGEMGAASWIPLWSGAENGVEPDEAAITNRRRTMGWADDELVVMYSGNMGLGHRFGEILQVIGQQSGGAGQDAETETAEPTSKIKNHQSSIINQSPPLTTRFVFFGGGKRRGEVEDFLNSHPGLPVELHDYAPADLLPVHLRSADVHLASLAPEWSGTMVPSKLQGIFQAGRPVIFIGDPTSSIGRWVADSGGGWLVKPGDPAALAHALDDARNPASRNARGAAAKAFAKSHFQRAANAREVAGRLASCADDP